MNAKSEPLLTADEVAEWLHYSVDNVFRLVRTQALPYVSMGRKSKRFDRAAVQAWLDARATVRVPAAPAPRADDARPASPSPATSPLPCWSGKRRAKVKSRPAG